MFDNFIKGWKLGGAVRKLVMKDKSLSLFPILSAIVIILESIAIFIPLILFTHNETAVSLLLLIIYYIVTIFTSSYILAAMLIQFNSFLNGERSSITTSFSKAKEFWLQLIEWSLFQTAIILVITAISQIIKKDSGALIMKIFDLAASFSISIASMFAIPIILEEKTGPIKTLKKSVEFILNNFGNTFGGFFYSDLYPLLFIILGLLIVIVGIFAIISLPILIAAIIIILGLALLAYGLILRYLLFNTFKFIIYKYKTEGYLPEGIDGDLINNSIKVKNKVIM